MAKQQDLQVFLLIRQTLGGEQIKEQTEEVQEGVDEGVHGSSISGVGSCGQGTDTLGRLFAQYTLGGNVQLQDCDAPPFDHMNRITVLLSGG